MNRHPDPRELARRLLEALGEPSPANEDEIDEAELTARAHRIVERMRRARNR